jgi:hypothetical protein
MIQRIIYRNEKHKTENRKEKNKGRNQRQNYYVRRRQPWKVLQLRKVEPRMIFYPQNFGKPKNFLHKIEIEILGIVPKF